MHALSLSFDFQLGSSSNGSWQKGHSKVQNPYILGSVIKCAPLKAPLQNLACHFHLALHRRTFKSFGSYFMFKVCTRLPIFFFCSLSFVFKPKVPVTASLKTCSHLNCLCLCLCHCNCLCICQKYRWGDCCLLRWRHVPILIAGVTEIVVKSLL